MLRLLKARLSVYKISFMIPSNKLCRACIWSAIKSGRRRRDYDGSCLVVPIPIEGFDPFMVALKRNYGGGHGT